MKGREMQWAVVPSGRAVDLTEGQRPMPCPLCEHVEVRMFCSENHASIYPKQPGSSPQMAPLPLALQSMITKLLMKSARSAKADS